jgi:hypothetical protein
MLRHAIACGTGCRRLLCRLTGEGDDEQDAVMEKKTKRSNGGARGKKGSTGVTG